MNPIVQIVALICGTLIIMAVLDTIDKSGKNNNKEKENIENEHK